jgi:hypothetical protein
MEDMTSRETQLIGMTPEDGLVRQPPVTGSRNTWLSKNS